MHKHKMKRFFYILTAAMLTLGTATASAQESSASPKIEPTDSLSLLDQKVTKLENAVSKLPQVLCVSASYTHYLHSLPLEYKLRLFRLLYWLGSVFTLCYWSGDYDFFDLRLLDYSLPRGQSIIYPRIIWGICHIIYFYILRQYRKTDRGFLFVAARIFFKIQSVCRHFFLRLRGGLWDFVELKGVSGGWHQIAPIYEFMELVMVCRASHTDGLSDRHGGQRNSIIVCVGCEV